MRLQVFKIKYAKEQVRQHDERQRLIKKHEMQSKQISFHDQQMSFLAFMCTQTEGVSEVTQRLPPFDFTSYQPD